MSAGLAVTVESASVKFKLKAEVQAKNAQALKCPFLLYASLPSVHPRSANAATAIGLRPNLSIQKKIKPVQLS